MIQLSETGEQLLPSFMFEVTGFYPYLCVPSPFSSDDNNSINCGLGFICNPWSLFCFLPVLSCSPLYSPFYHLILQPSIIVTSALLLSPISRILIFFFLFMESFSEPFPFSLIVLLLSSLVSYWTKLMFAYVYLFFFFPFFVFFIFTV